MSEFYDGVSGFFDGIVGLFSFLPPEFSTLLGGAFAVVISWIVISLALKIIGLFF